MITLMGVRLYHLSPYRTHDINWIALDPSISSMATRSASSSAPQDSLCRSMFFRVCSLKKAAGMEERICSGV